MSQEDYDEKPKHMKKGKKKKGKPKGLPNKYVPLPVNPDKKLHTGWADDPTRSIGNLPHPHRLIAVSSPSKGKTFTCQQLILRADPMYDAIILIHPYPNTKEWDLMNPTEIMSSIPDPTYFEQFEEQKVLCVLEDYEVQNKHDLIALSKLFRWVSSHMCGGVSIYLLYQNFSNCPIIARRCADVFLLWDDVDLNCRGIIEKRTGLQKGELSDLFKLCDDPRDSIMIDRTANSPFPLRKNIFQAIKRSDGKKHLDKPDLGSVGVFKPFD